MSTVILIMQRNLTTRLSPTAAEAATEGLGIERWLAGAWQEG